MSKTYSDITIQEAKNLVETTEMSYPEIAEQLNVDRWMTIYDWKKKYGWKRAESSEPDIEIEEIWRKIGEKALTHLQDGDFKTMTEALKVYDQAKRHIKNAEKMKEAGDSKGGVLKTLEIVGKATEIPKEG